MRLSVKILAVGWAVAGALLSGAWLLLKPVNLSETELIELCELENRVGKPRTEDQLRKGTILRVEGDAATMWRSAPLECSPYKLPAVGAVGIQADIVKVHRDSNALDEWANVALGIALLSVVPWVWYFLLRRVAEVRHALSGQVPQR